MSCVGFSDSKSCKHCVELTASVKDLSALLVGLCTTDFRTTEDEDERSSSIHSEAASRFTKPSSGL